MELGAPVVLRLGHAPPLVHLPRPTRAMKHGRFGERIWTLIDRLELRGPMEEWPTLCGLAGDVFVWGGPIRDLRVCAVCRAKAGRTHQRPKLAPLRPLRGRDALRVAA